jgi:hypothetical protein
MGTGSEWIAASSGDSENDTVGSCEAHHVGSSPKEDCGVSKSTMGKAESSTEEGCVDICR